MENKLLRTVDVQPRTSVHPAAPDGPQSTPPSALSTDAGVYGDGGSNAWAGKTRADGDAARATRREQARAELERCDREARTAQAEAELRRARQAEAHLDELGRFLDREAQAAQDEQWRYIDQCETRRLHDWDFRARYDRHHPGGADHCTCDAHRAWRREPPS